MHRLAGILVPSNLVFQKDALFAFGFIYTVKVSAHNADKEYVLSYAAKANIIHGITAKKWTILMTFGSMVY